MWLLDYLPNTATACLARILGVHGENLTIQTACAASTQALGQAFHAVRHGLVDVAIAGGGDSRLSPEGIHAYKGAGVLATVSGHPGKACRPFDQKRSGFAIGEGGAVFVLEGLQHAQARKASILAEITAASSSLDGYSLTGPDPEGTAGRTAVARCLPQPCPSGLCVIAHGTGTMLNDAVESDIIKSSAADATAIAAFKSRIGHLASACGGAELALALVCAHDGVFPAIANLENPCRSDLPFLTRSAVLQPHMLLVQSFGFGGQNACLAVQPWY